MKKFSDRLRHARLQRDYTQVELARLAGLSQSAVASYESGERKSSRAIFKLATALGVDAQWLDTGKGPMAPTKTPLHRITDYPLRKTPVDLLNSPTSTTEREWPFHIPRRYYHNLTSHHKQLLEKLVKIFIEACQNVPEDD